MLTHPTNPRRLLVERGDLDPLSLPLCLLDHEIHLRAVFDWAQHYLCRPHPDLGRTGNVCPFASPSLQRNRFFLAVPASGVDRPAAVLDTLRFYRRWFLDLAPRGLPGSQISTILVLFPNTRPALANALIDAVQPLLKREYVRTGLMVGEFHTGPPRKPGLWNADFRPLRSPVPMLAIRHMVASDLPFLRDDPEQAAVHRSLFGSRTAPLVLRPAAVGPRTAVVGESEVGA